MAEIAGKIEMLWYDLLHLQKWCPLAQITYEYEVLDDNLCRFEDTKYFLRTPYTVRDGKITMVDGGPFLSALVWACGDGAVLRAVRQELEKDDGRVLTPPRELLPSDNVAGYGAILAGLRSNGAVGIIECASYRIATDGLFLHRTIMSNIADYHFRSREDRSDEVPYAIVWKLTR